MKSTPSLLKTSKTALDKILQFVPLKQTTYSCIIKPLINVEGESQDGYVVYPKVQENSEQKDQGS